ncbi:hypothetical protein EVAR_70827_1 [Eumeta japonica]|uniref:Uncharacterized protein n=1 Tax=Eumeta variegata TaxID=151549 RepID=A0A4C2AGK7_EUMVA|nr:hypothetical protein EVAR_70827_1 [Eumeta japonica]
MYSLVQCANELDRRSAPAGELLELVPSFPVHSSLVRAYVVTNGRHCSLVAHALLVWGGVMCALNVSSRGREAAGTRAAYTQRTLARLLMVTDADDQIIKMQ